MNVQHASTAVTESYERHSSAHLQGRWLLLARVGWLALVIFTLGIFFASLPVYLALLHTPCAGTACGFQQLTPERAVALKGIGLFPDAYTAYTIALTIVTLVVCLVISTVIIWRRSHDRMALIVALMLVTLGPFTMSVSLSASPSPWQVPNACLSFLFLILFILVFSLLPSGQFVPHWMRWPIVVFIAVQVPFFFFPDALVTLNISDASFGYLLFLGGAATLVVAQMYRYRRVSSLLQRQQTKWVLFGFALPITVYILGIVSYLMFPVLAVPSSLYLSTFEAVQDFLLLLIPLSFGFAMLRYRLWDIDILINRTLVYGTLTASAVGVYVLVVGGLGALLQARGSLGLSLLATGLIAVLIQPLHTRLQRAVNRLLYGERDEPYKVISRLGQRLEATLAPEAVLPTIVTTVTQALRLPYAAINLKQDGEDVIAASSGRATDELTHLPLVYQSEHIGDFLLAPRARGESFSSADQVLLADLARQAGIAVHAVRLTTDLQRLTKELQHSRTELVTAREEERRRLRRDLHDGLGSVLASLNWRAGALRLLLSRDPVAADALVVEQQNTIQAAIGDIRRLVYNLRPPALDELGLIGAIREQAAKQSAPAGRDSALGLHVEVVAPDHLLALPAAVEVAAYRIVQEALANVVRHAQAHRCWICLSYENDLLHVEVSDDGIGLPESSRAGVGLLSLRERAAELGGTCDIVRMPEGGTCVRTCLPRLMHDEQL